MKALLLALALVATPAGAQTLHSWALDAPLPPGVTEEPSPVRGDSLRLTTAYVMAGVVLALVAYDVFLGATHRDTESQVITDYAWRYSSIPYCLGILIGHWLFTHSDPWSATLWPVMAVSVGVVLAWDLLIKHDGERAWSRYPGAWFAVGVPVGALLWGQRHQP